MRRAIVLVLLFLVPLSSGVMTQNLSSRFLAEQMGDEIIIFSPDVTWQQDAWGLLEGTGYTPLRLISPYELLAWRDVIHSELDPSLIVKNKLDAEWRGGFENDFTSHSGDLKIVFEPNLPDSAIIQIVDIFTEIGFEISRDIASYQSPMPHSEVIIWSSWMSFYLEGLLEIDGVLWIEPVLETKARNVVSAGLMSDGKISQPIPWSLGLNGSGVVLGIADSGLDYDHSCFRNATSPTSYGSDGENGSNAVGVFGESHRKIILINQSIDSEDTMGHINFRHGTHTAGTLACFDVYDYRNNSIPSNGSSMSHNAKIVVQDIVSAEGWMPPDNVSQLLSEAALLGGIIHSNSWGDSTTAYTARSGNFDAWSVEMPWSLAFIAPGNSGGQLFEPANARNVAAIGASVKSENSERSASSSIGSTEAGTYGIFALAPGVLIQSAHADGIADSYNNGLRVSSGTSMATPMAASFAAVIQQLVQDGWLMGSNEDITPVNISSIIPQWAKISENSIMLGGGFSPSGPLLKSIMSIAATPIVDKNGYFNRDNLSGFGILNLSELIILEHVISDLKIGNASPSDDIWIHDSFRLVDNTPKEWLENRTDGFDVMGDLIANPWDGSGAVGPFLSTGQNWTKRLVPNGEDVIISMSFPTLPEPHLVDDLQLIVHLSNGKVAIGDNYDKDGFSSWYNSTVELDNMVVFPNSNETSVTVKFSASDLVGVEWLDLEINARYVSPGNSPGYLGISGNKVGFSLAAKGVIRDSTNWEDSDGDGFANVEDICPNENSNQWDIDGDGCIDDSDKDGLKDNIDSCLNEDSRGYDQNRDGCIDDSDFDGVNDVTDLCNTEVIDLLYPVDSTGCRPSDSVVEIRNFSVTGIKEGVWNNDLYVQWSVSDLDLDSYTTGARILLHQNSSALSSFTIADCNYAGEINISFFECSWSIPGDLPIFYIGDQNMHIQIYAISLNASPEANIAPQYLDDSNVFTSDWKNPLLEEEDNQRIRDEAWGVTQRRVLMWGVLGLIGIGVFMARIWSVNTENGEMFFGTINKKRASGFESDGAALENE
jgi:hypothetical protein